MFRVFLLVVMVSGVVNQGWAKPELSQGRRLVSSKQIGNLLQDFQFSKVQVSRWWKKFAVTMAFVSALSTGTPVLGNPLALDFSYEGGLDSITAAVPGAEGAVWRKIKIKRNAPHHHLSTFYLLFTNAVGAWRVMHIEYIGNNSEDEPLFVGPRFYISAGKDRVILDRVESSLVNHAGLVKQGVEVEEVASFSHPEGDVFDLTVLTIAGVNMEEYEPIELAPYSEPDISLEMLSYRADLADNLLGFFAYPLRYRNCLMGKLHPEDAMAIHTCTIPFTPAVIGSPIFMDGALVLLYFGVNDDGESYGTIIHPGLLQFMQKELDVDARGRVSLSWGSFKKQ